MLAAPPALHAGTIGGQVLTTPVRTPSKGAQPPEEEPADVVQRGVTEAVVYVESVPDEVENKLTKHRWWKRRPRIPRIVQANLRFSPRVLTTVAGSEVEFANLDRVFHNTFSVSTARRFDLGKYAPGHVDTVAFDRPGVANLHCDIHPKEIGFVVVVPNHVYARPDSFGWFTLPKLPEGSYKVRVWHPRLGEISRKVALPKRGDLDIEFKY